MNDTNTLRRFIFYSDVIFIRIDNQTKENEGWESDQKFGLFPSWLVVLYRERSYLLRLNKNAKAW